MQRPRYNTRFAFPILVVLACAGCGSGPNSSRQPALYDQPQPPSQETADALNPGSAQGAMGSTTELQMQRLLARLDTLEADNAQLKRQLSDQYMEALRKRRAEIEAQQNGDSSHSVMGTGTDQGTAPGPSPQTPRNAPAGLSTATRDQLFDALARKIAQGDDSARTKALMAAALSIAGPGHEMDPTLLEALDHRSREQVARFHQMLAVTFDELAGDEKRTLTRREMIEQIDRVFGAQPLKIEALELCRRVDSYGVYEPFASTRFLAGRKNRMLVYVELENFHHEPTEDGQYEVRLEQQVELYDATGETTVWRQGPVELKDVSRNKRRDFFIVYPVDLPARLTAGAYRLKVRIADKHTGSICEQTLHDIRVVADRALVGADQ